MMFIKMWSEVRSDLSNVGNEILIVGNEIIWRPTMKKKPASIPLANCFFV